jgi:hypothetical protein
MGKMILVGTSDPLEIQEAAPSAAAVRCDGATMRRSARPARNHFERYVVPFRKYVHSLTHDDSQAEFGRTDTLTTLGLRFLMSTDHALA